MSEKSNRQPLKNPKVEVRAIPDYEKDEQDWGYVDRVQENVKRGVEDALDKTKGDGVSQQVAAANDAVDDAGGQVNSNRVDRIHVEIDDDDGRHFEIDSPAGEKD
jgi:hypothetical protein